MAKQKSDKSRQMSGVGMEAVETARAETARAETAGAAFEWHFGRLTRMGHSEMAGPAVTIVWEEGGVTSQQGTISEEEWEIFKLAFVTTGRIAVLSDQQGEEWMYDYRFLEAVR